jgi:predicted nuclease of restriction endonuclease-like (RecB) superfamily
MAIFSKEPVVKESKNHTVSSDNESRKSHGRKRKDVLLPAPPSKMDLPRNYEKLLKELKERIQRQRLKTVLSANKDLVLLYWDIGNSILTRQEAEGWGAKIIDRISHDLTEVFPDMRGFSSRNLKYMRAFSAAWPDREIVQQVVAQIPWGSNIALLNRLNDSETRLWYAEKIIENGWSRAILNFQIDTELHKRQGKTISNFEVALPPADSDMATQIFKDPYVFDFLGTADPRREAELEQKLMDHLQKFLLELGAGFAFVGRQVHVELGSEDFYIDMLFYHLRLRCYVVVELKAGKFKPDHVSKLNMYLNIVDDLLLHPDDKPTIGLLLVKEKDQVVVEYSLAGYLRPMGVAEWERKLSKSIPDELKPNLPTIEEIEAELCEETD